jgi:uncharacterized low-complexity protein
MRIVPTCLAAGFLVASTFAAYAAPAASSFGMQPQSGIELVKSKSKATKTSTHKAGHKRIKTSAKGGPGHCGTMKYWSKNQCVSAVNKKPSVSWPNMIRGNEEAGTPSRATR